MSASSSHTTRDGRPTFLMTLHQLARAPRLVAVFSFVLLLTGVHPLHAQDLDTYIWLNLNGGNYSSPANWLGNIFDPGIPDNSGEAAMFLLNSAYTVDIADDYTVGDLSVERGDVTLSFETTCNPLFCTTTSYNTSRLSVEPAAGDAAALKLSSGNMTVQGDASIGSNGQGSLELGNAHLATVGASLGAHADSSGRLTIDDRSSLTSSAPLVLGGAGSGLLEILAGSKLGQFGIGLVPAQGSVASPGVVMGQSEPSGATANISGHWTTGNLIVGDAGRAEVNFLGTEIVVTTLPGQPPIDASSVGIVASENVSIAAQPGSSGTVNVTGSVLVPFVVSLASEWQISDSLAVGGQATAAGGSGRLAVGRLNKVSVGADLTLWPGGTLSLAATGAVTVTGSARLDGTLEFVVPETIGFSSGTEWEILTAAGGVSGTFATTHLPPLEGGLRLLLQYRPTSVLLRVVEGLAGDYNQDGLVNAADFVNWRNHVGAPAGTLPNDPAGGEIGQAQYDTWRANFAATSEFGLAGSAVPEPSARLLAIAALAFAVVGRRRTRLDPG